MVDETISEKCETLYNKLNSFVESEISRDVTPQISNLNSRIDALEPNLVRVKEVEGNVSSVSAGGTSTQTFTVPACPSGYGWKYFSTSTGWGTVSSVSLSGTTLTVTLLNVSNTSHDISFSGALMYYPTTMKAEQHISISATNPYLLEGEVTDLVVSLVDEFGLPLRGKTVTIGQSVFIDNGTTASHNDNWYNQNSSFTRTRTDTGTNLKITSPSANLAYFSGGSGTWASTKLYTAPFNVEFEITEITTGTPNFEIRGDNTYFTWTCSQVGSYRVEITDTKVRKYFNGTMDIEYDRTMNEVYAIGFRQNASTEFKYKNFKIYKTINGVTDEKGEFALHDVSVSQDTTFTATYGGATDSCLVEYCQFVDYGVTGNTNYTSFYNYNTFNPQVSDTGTLLTNNANTTYNYFANLDSTSDLYDFTAPFTLELDIVSFSGSVIGTQIGESGQSGAIRNFSQLGITQPCHLKLIVDGTQIIYQVDNETVMTQNYTVTQGRVSLILNSATLEYKNFRIREG